MNFHNCKSALRFSKRARRKSWRDGQYITSSYRGRYWGELPIKSCNAYRIGVSKSTIEWQNMEYDMLQDDWEIIPEPDYAEFGKDVCSLVKGGGGYHDGLEIESLQELAARHGLCHLVTYDPDIHGVIMDVDPGDGVYFFEE